MRKLKPFIWNIFYWLFHFWQLLNAVRNMKYEKEKLKTLANVRTLMNKFVWTEEKTNWMSWVITTFNRDYEGDCEDSALLDKWALKKIGIKSDLYVLSSDRYSHMVTINKDKNIMISNASVIKFDAVDWKEKVLSFFQNNYTQIEKY